MLCDNTVQICTDIANLIWWKVNTKITTEYRWYVPQYIRFTNNFEKLSFFTANLIFTQWDILNSKNVVSLRKTVDECKSYWFVNLFSNFLILRALSRKKVPKITYFICCSSRLFLRILWKYSFFVFIWPLRLKLIYIHKNKVYSMFPSNFIREIKKLVFYAPAARIMQYIMVMVLGRNHCQPWYYWCILYRLSKITCGRNQIGLPQNQLYGNLGLSKQKLCQTNLEFIILCPNELTQLTIKVTQLMIPLIMFLWRFALWL
jgi:hypothetical protein